jgi:hypothetical protein
MVIRIRIACAGALLGCCIAALLAFCPRVWAGPLDQTKVDQRATWLVHIDVEAMMDSPLGGALIQNQTSALHGVAEDMRADLGLDPITDVRSLTLYASGEHDRHGVALLVTSPAADRLGTLLHEQHADAVETSRHGENDLWAWNLHGERWHACVLRESDTRRLVVLSQSRRSITESLDVIEGRLPSLAQRAPMTDAGSEDSRGVRLSPNPSRNSMIFVTACGDFWNGLPREPRTDVFRGARMFTFDASEQRDECGARWMVSNFCLRMDSPEAATSAQKVVDGAVSWLKLIGQGEKTPACARQAVNAITSETVDGAVVLNAKVRMTDLVRLAAMIHGEGNASDGGYQFRLSSDIEHTPNKDTPGDNPDSSSKNSDTKPFDKAKNPGSGVRRADPR